jgi:hypothetical protein
MIHCPNISIPVPVTKMATKSNHPGCYYIWDWDKTAVRTAGKRVLYRVFLCPLMAETQSYLQGDDFSYLPETFHESEFSGIAFCPLYFLSKFSG